MAALRCLLLLLCGAALGPAVHLDFAEHRSQAAKIKVNPRGNLWATGHFMGKKSVTGSPRLESPEEPAVPMVFGPSLRALLEDMMELLTRELLKILLQERLLDENQGKYDLADQAQVEQSCRDVSLSGTDCSSAALTQFQQTKLKGRRGL
ncbi:neuromedin-B isoform X3 [Harpia harpyja]|uniref:neuromedin-B isoform X3 n=1 Tax=Harpia harpyja TaxID=202280 RepID=UPI0022B0FD55|nr:neuromedin-B isoform X3 [Harpia harpyja]